MSSEKRRRDPRSVFAAWSVWCLTALLAVPALGRERGAKPAPNEPRSDGPALPQEPAPAPAPGPAPSPAPSPAVQKLETAAQQVQHATGLKTGLRGMKDGNRKQSVAQVVAAYRAVRLHWPEDAEACAEAGFRAGELLRGEGDPEGARGEFLYVRGLSAPTPFRSRAGLELGHLERRSKRHAQALAAYLALVDDPKTEPEFRDEAALWAGRAYLALDKPEEARRQWKAVAARAEDPLQRIEAWDELALDLVEVGDLEGAAGWIARARESLADAALEETAQGERVRKSLERMRAIRRLERAVSARDAAGGSTPGSTPNSKPPSTPRTESGSASAAGPRGGG
jgi:tetratricopeptide (TPR) repeat protein